MFSRIRYTRGRVFKALTLLAGAVVLTLVPFLMGSGEETPSVEDVRIQVERMFASESAPALQIGGEAACEEASQNR